MGQLQELHRLGRIWLRGLLSNNQVFRLAELTDVGAKPGIRLPLTNELSTLIGPGSALASQICELGVHAKPVRIVAFNKTQEANWSVPWHQDRVIAIRQKAQIDGYSNWVAKSNFWHCEPPLSLLEKMVFVRIHIDDSTEETGLLELALGSHKFGKIPSHRAHALASDCDIELCEARPGDVLIVHALTLHRSSSAITPSTRRAVRADYACRSMLARELQWAI